MRHRIADAILVIPTKLMEWYIALRLVQWAAWLLVVDHEGQRALDQALARYADSQVWGWITALIAVLCVVSLLWRYPAFRRLSSGVCTVYFGTLIYLVYVVDPRIFVGWTFQELFVFSGIVFMQRTAKANLAPRPSSKAILT